MRALQPGGYCRATTLGLLRCSHRERPCPRDWAGPTCQRPSLWLLFIIAFPQPLRKITSVAFSLVFDLPLLGMGDWHCLSPAALPMRSFLFPASHAAGCFCPETSPYSTQHPSFFHAIPILTLFPLVLPFLFLILLL